MATYTGIKKIKIGDNIFELAVDWSAVTSKPTIPSDEKVKQTNTTTSAAYELLFSYTADNTERTEGARKTSTLTYNPSTKELVNGVAKLKSATSTTANTAAYDTLTLGNNVAVSSTTAHSQGQLILYGSTAYAHTIQGAPTAARTITLPDATGTVSLTDEKLKTQALTSGTTYYPILATGAGDGAVRQVDSTIGGFKYKSTAGTTSVVGTAYLYLGNATASGTANNEKGILTLYGDTAYGVSIATENNQPTANRTIYLPSYAGTMYLTCTSTTDAVGGATTAPVYVDNTGRIQAVTSIPYSLLTGTPTIPTVPSDIVNKITTTSGAHTAITNATGNVSFNVPTKTSQLTNDSGFITSDSDEKVKTAALTSGTAYYPILATGTGTATRQIDSTLGGLKYTSTAGTTSTVGTAVLQLGNATASGTANNEQGILRLYCQNAKYADIKVGISPTNNMTINLAEFLYIESEGNNTIDIRNASESYTVLTDAYGNYQYNGGVRPWFSTTGTSTLSSGSASAYSNSPTINARSTDSGRYYAVEIDHQGRLFVNVPAQNATEVSFQASDTSVLNNVSDVDEALLALDAALPQIKIVRWS